MLAEDRLKIKQYKFECEALQDFLDGDVSDLSAHVVNAVRSRLSVVNHQIKMLS